MGLEEFLRRQAGIQDAQANPVSQTVTVQYDPAALTADDVRARIVAFPIAMGLFCPAFGLILRPEIAAISMAGSSFLVAVNALLLSARSSKGSDVMAQHDAATPWWTA